MRWGGEARLPTSATQNELGTAAAAMVRHGCIAVGEGANMPTTPDACGAPGNYVVGANVAAFTRVADAMLALGMVQASSPRRG